MFSVDHRRLMLTIVIIITIIGLFGLTKLRVEISNELLIEKESPAQQNYEKVKQRFNIASPGVIYLSQPALFTPKYLQIVWEAHSQLEDSGLFSQVKSLFNASNINYESDSIAIGPVFNDAPKTETEAMQGYLEAKNNPLFMQYFVSQNPTTMLIHFNQPPDEYAKNSNIKRYDTIDKVIHYLNANGISAFQIGKRRLDEDQKELVKDDAIRFIPIACLVIILICGIVFRNVFSASLALISGIVSLIWIFGGLGLLGHPVTIFTSMLPLLIIILGTTEIVHMYSAYLHATNESGPDRYIATQLMAKKIGRATILTIITTAIGFLGGSFCKMPVARDYAIVCGIAILINGLVSIILVPMLLSMFGPKKSIRLDYKIFNKFAECITNIVLKKKLLILCIFIFSTTFFIFYSTKTTINSDPISFLRPNVPFIQDYRHLTQDFPGGRSFNIHLKATQPNAFKSPENLKRIFQIKQIILSDPAFVKVFSLADQIALINQEVHDGDENYHRIPANQNLIAQYFLLLPNHDIDDFITSDGKETLLYINHDISQSEKLDEKLQSIQDKVLPILGQDIKMDFTGLDLIIHDTFTNLVYYQLESLIIIFIFILILMSVILRSLTGGIIALVPNIFPTIVIFGTMGLFNIPMTPATAFIALIILGLSIDDTIHLISKYQQHFAENKNYQQAISKTIFYEIRPVITTSVALVMGMLIFLLSNFQTIAYFGIIAATGMLAATIADLFITPILLIAYKPKFTDTSPTFVKSQQ